MTKRVTSATSVRAYDAGVLGGGEQPLAVELGADREVGVVDDVHRGPVVAAYRFRERREAEADQLLCLRLGEQLGAHCRGD